MNVVLFLLALLNLEDFFLGFDFAPEVFFGREVCEVFGSEELGIFVEYGVFRDVLACLGAENQTDGGVVAFGAFEVIVHPHIHVHLPDILVGDFRGLEVNEQKGFQQVVVEDEVYVEVSDVCAYVLLACDKCVAFAEFEQEFLDMCQYGAFEVGFRIVNVAGKPEEFGHDGILDELVLVFLIIGCILLHLADDRFLVLGLKETEVVL